MIGLYSYRARWYDPALGRFTSPDPVAPVNGNPVAWDPYGYTLNNPVKYIDPSGYGVCGAADARGQALLGAECDAAGNWIEPAANRPLCHRPCMRIQQRAGVFIGDPRPWRTPPGGDKSPYSLRLAPDVGPGQVMGWLDVFWSLAEPYILARQIRAVPPEPNIFLNLEVSYFADGFSMGLEFENNSEFLVSARILTDEVDPALGQTYGGGVVEGDPFILQRGSQGKFLGPSPADPQYSNSVNVRVTVLLVGRGDSEFSPQLHEIEFIVPGLFNWPQVR